jgi:ubiquitin carboxyl-terminal hydrolase 14
LHADLDEWWRFDDSKVTSVPESKILSLDGGGEADTAYSTLPVFKANSVLLYRAKEFPKRT